MFGDTYDTLEKIINRNVHDEISLFNENELSILTSLTISAINRNPTNHPERIKSHFDQQRGSANDVLYEGTRLQQLPLV